jgi:hypothetical protein
MAQRHCCDTDFNQYHLATCIAGPAGPTRPVQTLTTSEVQQFTAVAKSLQQQEQEQERGPVKLVAGVGPDAPVVTNERGGGQSKAEYHFTSLDPLAMFEMTKVLAEGDAKYGTNNWRKIDIEDHLNHLIIHAYAYLAGDRSDEHLSHIMCRAMFAQAVKIEEDRFNE